VHFGRERGRCHHPPVAILVVAKTLPAMQEPAAYVGLLGVERGLDLPSLRLSDQKLSIPAADHSCLTSILTLRPFWAVVEITAELDRSPGPSPTIIDSQPFQRQ